MQGPNHIEVYIFPVAASRLVLRAASDIMPCATYRVWPRTECYRISTLYAARSAVSTTFCVIIDTSIPVLLSKSLVHLVYTRRPRIKFRGIVAYTMKFSTLTVSINLHKFYRSMAVQLHGQLMMENAIQHNFDQQLNIKMQTIYIAKPNQLANCSVCG